jgi:predicted O-linked N-acetylglucosamine transferase (SPINDLY family)
MSKQDNSGPAFPRHRLDWSNLNSDRPELVAESQGLSIRDYFAAKAMQGIIAAKMPITKEMDCCAAVSKAAYMQADAMLKARQS